MPLVIFPPLSSRCLAYFPPCVFLSATLSRLAARGRSLRKRRKKKKKAGPCASANASETASAFELDKRIRWEPPSPCEPFTSPPPMRHTPYAKQTALNTIPESHNNPEFKYIANTCFYSVFSVVGASVIRINCNPPSDISFRFSKLSSCCWARHFLFPRL